MPFRFAFLLAALVGVIGGALLAQGAGGQVARKSGQRCGGAGASEF